MTDESLSLLPCAHCGGAPKLSYVGNDRTPSRKLTVKCSSCRMQLTHSARMHDFAWLEMHIAAAWNRRAPPLDALRALEQKWRERSADAGYTASERVAYSVCADELAATIKAMGGPPVAGEDGRDGVESAPKAVWLNCSLCNKCWKAADLPMDMDELGNVLKKQKCPTCGDRKKVILAKPFMIKAAMLGEGNGN